MIVRGVREMDEKVEMPDIDDWIFDEGDGGPSQR